VSNAVEVNELTVASATCSPSTDVTLHVAYGEVVTLLGPNGAGKTTVVETLLGFRSPTSGTVRLHGLNPVRDHREVVVRTGALLQRGGVWFPDVPAPGARLTASYYDAPRDTGRPARAARPRAMRLARRGDASAVANSSAPCWRWRCSDDRASWSWTNRRPRSTPRAARSSATSSLSEAVAVARC
jgi:ABC-type dipeptide/oligopeptide/nickel transport system ATPase component